MYVGSCMRHILVFLFFCCVTTTSICYSGEDALFWWKCHLGSGNFGDELSHVIVEKIIGRNVTYSPLESKEKCLLSVGSILHFAKDGDLILGSGFRENPLLEKRFHTLDVRAVRGPRTRDFLLKMGIACPEVYGDPALLLSDLFPEFKEEKPIYDYIIIPNIGEIECFRCYKNVVLPTEPWYVVVRKIAQSKFVISSSLHGIIVAESFGIPARLLKMTWIEPLLKYQDYYESTSRPNFRYATSVQEALALGGEEPGDIDRAKLLDAFPWDYFCK